MGLGCKKHKKNRKSGPEIKVFVICSLFVVSALFDDTDMKKNTWTRIWTRRYGHTDTRTRELGTSTRHGHRHSYRHGDMHMDMKK